jgi:hypothetical protein
MAKRFSAKHLRGTEPERNLPVQPIVEEAHIEGTHLTSVDHPSLFYRCTARDFVNIAQYNEVIRFRLTYKRFAHPIALHVLGKPR